MPPAAPPKDCPICTECHNAKVKCDRKFPCSRCIELDLGCFPHEGKSGRPSKRKVNPFASKMKSMRCYTEYLPLEQKDRVADLMSLFYYKIRHLSDKHSTNPRTTGPWSGKIDDAETDFLKLRLRQLDQSYVSPPPEEVDAELQRYREWVPAPLLDMVQRGVDAAQFGAASMFVRHYYGQSVLEMNSVWPELFFTREELASQREEAAANFNPDMMQGWVGGDVQKAPQAGFMPVHVHKDDESQFFASVMQALLRGIDERGCAAGDHIYNLKLRTGQYQLFHVWRYCWLSKGAVRGSMLIIAQPLPNSQYIKKATNECNAAKRSKPNAAQAEEPMPDVPVKKGGWQDAQSEGYSVSIGETQSSAFTAPVPTAEQHLCAASPRVVLKEEETLRAECLMSDETIGEILFDLTDLLGIGYDERGILSQDDMSFFQI